jgi:hypothetical protein
MDSFPSNLLRNKKMNDLDSYKIEMDHVFKEIQESLMKSDKSKSRDWIIFKIRECIVLQKLFYGIDQEFIIELRKSLLLDSDLDLENGVSSLIKEDVKQSESQQVE